MFECFACCNRSVHLPYDYDDLDNAEIRLETQNTTQYSRVPSHSPTRPSQHTNFWDSVAALFHKPQAVRLSDDLSEARPFYNPGIDFEDRDGNSLVREFI